jgi:choloylglycine hydrolase
LLSANDGSFVCGRSMEFGQDLYSLPVVVKPGHTFVSPAPIAPFIGMKWTVKYGYVGMNGFGVDLVAEGMNQMGLSAGALWLPGSVYQSVTSNAQALDIIMLTEWLLGSFATCAEVAAAVADPSVVQVWASSGQEAKLDPLHIAVHDAQGNSLVIEYTGGQPKVYQNPIAVLTNAPTFDWHLSNIGCYTSLTSMDASSVTLDGQSYPQSGHGSGLRGIPGDYTPPSRLMKIAFLKQSATPPAAAKDAHNLAWHLLNSVDIAKGVASYIDNGKTVCDYTQWAVVKDLTNLLFSFRYYGELDPLTIDLKTIDFGTVQTGRIPLPARTPAMLKV